MQQPPTGLVAQETDGHLLEPDPDPQAWLGFLGSIVLQYTYFVQSDRAVVPLPRVYAKLCISPNQGVPFCLPTLHTLGRGYYAVFCFGATTREIVTLFQLVPWLLSGQSRK